MTVSRGILKILLCIGKSQSRPKTKTADVEISIIAFNIVHHIKNTRIVAVSIYASFFLRVSKIIIYYRIPASFDALRITPISAAFKWAGLSAPLRPPLLNRQPVLSLSKDWYLAIGNQYFTIIIHQSAIINDKNPCLLLGFRKGEPSFGYPVDDDKPSNKARFKKKICRIHKAKQKQY